MEVAAFLEQNDVITQIYRVTGKSKLHVHAVASSNEEMEELMYETIDKLPGVLECSLQHNILQNQGHQRVAAVNDFLSASYDKKSE